MYALSILFCQYFSQQEFSAKFLSFMVYAMATTVAMNFFFGGRLQGVLPPLKGEQCQHGRHQPY